VTYSAVAFTLDATVTCSATGSYTIGLYLDVDFSGAASLQGVSTLIAGANAGFYVTATASNTVTVVLSSSTIVSAIDSTLWAQITTALTAKAGFIQVDASGNAVTTIPVTITGAASISVTLTVAGGASGTTNNYAFVSIKLNVPGLVFGTAYAITGFANQTFTYTDTAASSTASVYLSAQASGSLTVTKSTTPATTAPAGYTPLNVYLTIDLTGTADSNPFNAVISYTYTSAQLAAAGISSSNAANLKLAYYDTTSSSWVFPSGGHVDTTTMVVAQSTTHFSQWGVYGTSGVAALTANAFVVALAALFAVLMA
jgi:hypothetical protein